MFPKKVVDAFLGRDLPDYNDLLRLTPEELRERMRRLPVRPPIWKALRHEQRACLIAGAELGSFAFFLDTGVGKTLLSIALARYFKKLNRSEKFLVLVPNKINLVEWELEIEKHSPGTRYKLLDGSSTGNLDTLLNDPATFYITTYASLYHMGCVPVDDGTGKTKLKMHNGKLGQMCGRLTGVFADESILAQNSNSLIFKVLRRLTKGIVDCHFFVLCGTPLNRDPQSFWSQMFLVDHGETLGKSLGLFRAAFFKERKNRFSGFPEWFFDKKKEGLFRKVLGNRSIALKADQSTLPKVVPIQKRVSLPVSAEAFYKEQKKLLVQAQGNYQETKSAFLRMRQISSGFVGYHDDDEGVRAQLEFDTNPKLDQLLSLVDEIQDRHKFVIFCEFVFSGSMICRELDKRKIGHGRIYGKTKDPSEVRKCFDTDPNMRGLVIQNSCGGFGLNLQVASWAIYYESPVSAVMRKQTQRRVERQGSKHGKVFIVDLLMNGTYDDAILHFHAEGGDLLKSLVYGRNVNVRAGRGLR
jgi:SNF2 family DNA or RNA helicase